MLGKRYSNKYKEKTQRKQGKRKSKHKTHKIKEGEEREM
jgi:hypothetical protein